MTAGVLEFREPSDRGAYVKSALNTDYPQETIAPVALEMMADWIREHTLKR